MLLFTMGDGALHIISEINDNNNVLYVKVKYKLLVKKQKKTEVKIINA